VVKALKETNEQNPSSLMDAMLKQFDVAPVSAQV
jgi:hypothetical protein